LAQGRAVSRLPTGIARHSRKPQAKKMPINSAEVQLLFVDLQDDALSRGGLTQTEERLRVCARAMARIAKLYSLPTLQTLVPGRGDPRSISELIEELGQIAYVRSNPHSLADPAIAAALKRNNRPILAIGGLVSEVGLFHAVIGALEAGYQTHVLVDLSGGLSERTEQAAFRQMQHAGAVLSCVPTLATSMMQQFSGETESRVRLELHATLPKAGAGP
jgi:hypothetical protein